MTTTAIREKLHEMVNTADDKQVESIYSIFEDQIAEKYDHWEDEEFLNELETRTKDYESGKVKGIPWEEVKLKAQNRLKAKQQWALVLSLTPLPTKSILRPGIGMKNN